MRYRERWEKEARAFVHAWQTSRSLREVCEKTGLAELSASVRAARYRDHGVVLKRFGANKSNGPDQIQWDALAEYACALTSTSRARSRSDVAGVDDGEEDDLGA